MTYQALLDILTPTGIPFTCHHWEQPQPPPYGVYFDTGTHNFAADDIAYQICKNITVELYLSQRDEALEATLEAVLTTAGLYWDKDVTYVPNLRQYQISYEMEG